MQQDAEAHARRVTLLEETLALRDEKLAELQSKVDGLWLGLCEVSGY